MLNAREAERNIAWAASPTRFDRDHYADLILPQVKGKVYAFYNMGTRDFPIGEMFETLNDGKYHVVRFTRSGPNSTIQVDDLMMQTKMPRGGWTEHLVLACCYLPPCVSCFVHVSVPYVLSLTISQVQSLLLRVGASKKASFSTVTYSKKLGSLCPG